MLLAAVMLLSGSRTASAHASLVSARPAAGSRMPASPARIVLGFSELVDPELARITLVGGDGSETHLAVANDPRDVHSLIAPLGALAPGAYRVRWHVVSADGHAVRGSYVFQVGPGPYAAPPGAEDGAAPGAAVVGAPLLAALLRGIGMGSLMTLAGLLFFDHWPAARVTPSSGRVAHALSLAAPMFLTLHLLAWLVNAAPEHQLTGDVISAGLASDVGRMELWRTGAALLAAWALWLPRRGRLACTFAIAALLFSGAVGHPAAIHPVVTIPAKALHLIAGAAWTGGIAWLLTRDRADAMGLSRDAGRVSSVALVALLMVAASGLGQALAFLPTALDLFRTAYGAVTLAKVAGLLILVAFGAHHRYRVLPTLAARPATPARFTTTLRLELGMLAAMIMLGGMLAYLSPSARTDAAPDSHLSPTDTQ